MLVFFVVNQDVVYMWVLCEHSAINVKCLPSLFKYDPLFVPIALGLVLTFLCL